MSQYPRKGESRAYRGTVSRFLKAMGRSIVDDGDVSGLYELSALAAEVNDTLASTVRGLRERHAYSWEDVGQALGITRGAACNRFGDL